VFTRVEKNRFSHKGTKSTKENEGELFAFVSFMPSCETKNTPCSRFRTHELWSRPALNRFGGFGRLRRFSSLLLLLLLLRSRHHFLKLLQFLFARVANLDDFNVENEILAR